MGFYEDWLAKQNRMNGTNEPLATPMSSPPAVTQTPPPVMPEPPQVPGQAAVQNAIAPPFVGGGGSFGGVGASGNWQTGLVGSPSPAPPVPQSPPSPGVPLAFQNPLPPPGAPPTAPAPQWANVPLPSQMRVATPAAHPGNWSVGMPEASVMLPPGMRVPNPGAQGPDWSQINAAPGTPTQAFSGELSRVQQDAARRYTGAALQGWGTPAERSQKESNNAADARLQQMQQAADMRVSEAQQTPQAQFGKGGTGATYDPQTGQWTPITPPAKQVGPKSVPGGYVDEGGKFVQTLQPNADAGAARLEIQRRQATAAPHLERMKAIMKAMNDPLTAKERRAELQAEYDEAFKSYISVFAQGEQVAPSASGAAPSTTAPVAPWKPGSLNK